MATNSPACNPLVIVTPSSVYCPALTSRGAAILFFITQTLVLPLNCVSALDGIIIKACSLLFSSRTPAVIPSLTWASASLKATRTSNAREAELAAGAISRIFPI